MNRLSPSTIESKTPLGICLGGAAQDYSLLRVFGCPTYFNIKHDKLNLQVKKFVFLRVKIF